MPSPRPPRPFGELEAAVMDVLWDAEGPLRVRDVLEVLRPRRPLAYTTVMTVLDNLYRKDWLRRFRDGRAWRYEPVLSRQAHTAQLMRDALAVSEDRSGVLARFVTQIDPEDAAVLAAMLRDAGEDPDRGPRP